MATLIRTSKSGNQWTFNELEAYNIRVVEQEQDEFFNGPLPPYRGPAAFVQSEASVVDAASLALLKRLDLAAMIVKGEESAVDDFVAEILRALGYETVQTVIRTRKNIRLQTCGELVYANTDVCILDINSSLRLLVQEDKSHLTPSDPEAQLVAEAIAAFQHNNKKRVDELFLDPLEEQVIPGITVVGTFPRFYKIRVTSELDRCVRHGKYPSSSLIVDRHTPRVLGRRSDGMKPLDNRRLVLQCYEAFRKFVV